MHRGDIDIHSSEEKHGLCGSALCPIAERRLEGSGVLPTCHAGRTCTEFMKTLGAAAVGLRRCAELGLRLASDD